MTTLAPVIAIDGPSGSGKGTIAGILARKLGWCLLDSGALYRLLAFAARNHGVDLANEDALKMLAAHLDVQFIAAAEGHGQRIILEGEEVTEAHRSHAAEVLKERFRKDAERRRALKQAEIQEKERSQKLSQLVEKFGKHR